MLALKTRRRRPRSEATARVTELEVAVAGSQAHVLSQQIPLLLCPVAGLRPDLNLGLSDLKAQTSFLEPSDLLEGKRMRSGCLSFPKIRNDIRWFTNVPNTER